VVTIGTDLELWLGEVKFYKDVDDAIRAVVKEMHDHLDRDYLRGEFAFILNKLDSTWPHAATLQKLLDPNTSLDSIFKQVTIPVFLSYQSDLLTTHCEVVQAFLTDVENEVRAIYSSFCTKGLPTKVKLHLFLFPMRLKKDLVEAFDRRLEACQQLTS
jgi:Cap4 SAVED domain